MRIEFLNLTWSLYKKSISILNIDNGSYCRALFCVSWFDEEFYVDLFWINIIN